ncbi:monocarboxylate transporter 12-like [Argopecten irradians]|uniref:monocarboxylate transporter 12-like n=1 Tax=Argopecten irradians TaxID=31199 RepID=UPI00371585E5
MSLFYVPAFVNVGLYFEKRRSLATGIAVSGSGIGPLVLAPITEVFLQKYGWRGTLWIWSAVVLNTVVCGVLYRPMGDLGTTIKRPEDNKKTRTNSPETGCVRVINIFDLTLLQTPKFAVHMIVSCGYIAGYNIPFGYLPVHGDSVGLTSQESVVLIAIIGVTSTVSRVVIGYISDKPWVNTFVLTGTMLLIGGISTCLVPFYTSFTSLAAYSALYGLVTATHMVLLNTNLVKLMGQRTSPDQSDYTSC